MNGVVYFSPMVTHDGFDVGFLFVFIFIMVVFIFITVALTWD